jgi:uncharacterized damage-inducible protein DinB
MENRDKSYLPTVQKQFAEMQGQIQKSIDQLKDEDLHKIFGEDGNSIAILIQHLHGNMLSRFMDILTTDGEKPWRKRDAEFDEQQLSREKLMQLLNEGFGVVQNTLSSLKDDDLQKTVYIRHQPHSALEAVNRQLAHYAYHTGQIVMMAKMIKGKDWKTLTIPRGGTAAFNANMKDTFETQK